MLRKGLFRKPRIALEEYDDPHQAAATQPAVPDKLYIKCAGCATMVLSDELLQNNAVCPKCGYHFRLNARKRIALLCDADSFVEMDADLISGDPIAFPGYEEKIRQARERSHEKEAVVTGTAAIGGHPCVMVVMDPYFMMGSMGTAVGEKITRAFEHATANGLSVVASTCSGGARMQEGILSLMQMAKTSGAVRKHSDAGGLYIALLTDPTTGGVTASFAMLADITLAEPGALIAFAGPTVIEQTIKQKLPQGFQTAEFLLENGFVDAVIPRSQQPETLANLLALHAGRKEAGA